MTVKEAKAYLKHYPCVCKFGISPYACNDREGCEFSIAVRTLVEAETYTLEEVEKIRIQAIEFAKASYSEKIGS